MIYSNEMNKNNSDIANSSNLDISYRNEGLSVNNSAPLFKSDIPSVNKILVTYDDTEKSDKAIKYSIYLSNISGAEITILQVLGNLDKLENSYVNVSNRDTSGNFQIASPSSSSPESNSDKGQKYSVNVEGQIIKSMENKIKAIENTGFKNKVTYKIRTGWVVDEIVKEINESKYDLLIISSSHLSSWIKSLFSEARKIISNVDIPVLLLH